MAKIVNLNHARTKFQRDVMHRIKHDKVCPFCKENLLKYHTKPIIAEGKYWLLTTNFQPYQGSRYHFLAISKKHTRHFEDLSSAAQAEVFSLFSKELKKQKVKSGTFFMRFGDTDYTGSSVEHLHAHLVTGAKRGKNNKPISTYIGYSVK